MSVIRIAGMGGVAAALTAHAAAQTPAQAAADIQTYEPAYFNQYSPTSALDMVEQVPGFTLDEGETVRGFGGAAGNILINGERPSTKTGLSGLLGRIPAGSVIRIDLVLGAAADLDMRGQTKVVNVVVREDALAQPITFDATVRHTMDGRLSGRVQLSTQRNVLGGALTLSGVVHMLAGNGPGGGSFVDSGRLKYDASRVQTEYGEGFTEAQPLVGALNFEFERPTDWGAIRLNGGYTDVDIESDRFFSLYTPNSSGPLSGLETNATRIREDTWTLGGDIERTFGDISAKLITFHERETEIVTNRFGQFMGDGAFIRATTSAPELKTGESIVRGQVEWRLNDAHSIEIAAESAYNFIDNITELTLETPSGVTTFFVEGSDTKVEEFRNEFQISDVWTVSPSLTLEPGFKFETSRIEQFVNYSTAADLQAEREFEYPKPSITATWRMAPSRQMRVSYERDVAQLSFGNFVSSLELVNNQTTGGNPDLVPERAWAFDAELEQRFWTGGVVALFGSFDQVEDVQDFVPIDVFVADGPDADTDPDVITVDAPGNLGDGERWSLGVRASVPLDKLGVPNARVDLSVSGGGSSVTDPITGRSREFSDYFKENATLSYRHDFPQTQFSYGFRISRGGPATAYRLNETSRRSRNDADLSIWVETSRFFGVRIRAGVDDLLRSDYERTRVIYAADRNDAAFQRIERTWSSNGIQPFINVSGTF